MNNWPLHPGLYSHTRFFTLPGVQICTFPIPEWELDHSEACEKWCTKLILVEVPLVFPAFAHCVYTSPCCAEHHYTGSEQESILSNVLQAFPPAVQCVCNAQEHFSAHRAAKRPQSCCARWGDPVPSTLTRRKAPDFTNLALGAWVWWCQVRAQSLLLYSHSKSGMSRSWALPCPVPTAGEHPTGKRALRNGTMMGASLFNNKIFSKFKKSTMTGCE